MPRYDVEFQRYDYEQRPSRWRRFRERLPFRGRGREEGGYGGRWTQPEYEEAGYGWEYRGGEREFQGRRPEPRGYGRERLGYSRMYRGYGMAEAPERRYYGGEYRKSRWETDYGDPFRDRERGTPIRMMRGGWGEYGREFRRARRGRRFGYEREFHPREY